MTDRRYCFNLALLISAFLLCVAIWQRMSSTKFPSPKIGSKLAYSLNTQDYSGYVSSINLLSTSDYNQLIDLNFTFNILNLVCKDSPLILILIHSSPTNFEKRKTIRETWGKQKNEMEILFMLGQVQDDNLQRKLVEENRIYKDFAQGSFLDTYRNITYKHVMLFKYVIYHCFEAKYVLKTDDDVFINMPTMINFLTVDLSPYGASNLLCCTPRRKIRVIRSYRSKWRVSFSEYPEKLYPTYCPGWFLLYSPDVIFEIYKEAQSTEYFWIDDIHITGTLFKKLNKSHTNIESFVISSQDMQNVVDDTNNVSKPFLLGRPNLNEKQIRSLWKFVTTHPTPKSLLKYVPYLQ